MYEYSPAFTADQIQAMRAARPLASLIADETLGYDVWAGQRRLLSTSSSNELMIVALEAPDTTEVVPFREIWQPLLCGEEHAPYHRLDVVNTGTVSTTSAQNMLYKDHHVYLVHCPQNETIHNLGIVVTQPIRLHTTLTPDFMPLDRTQETLIAHRPDRCRILDVAGTQTLMQTVQLALEFDNK